MKRKRENQRTILDPKSLASCSRKRGEDGTKPHPIPLDLTIEILSRLPVKSLLRFICVSKLWFSIIRGGDFINSFSIQSSSRPRLLIAFHDFSRLFILSSPHPQNPREESSWSVANHHLTIDRGKAHSLSDCLRGFICIELWNRVLVWNPSTRQLLTLPPNKPMAHASLESSFVRVLSRYSFGYDPIDDQYKVFCAIPSNKYDYTCWKHQVFTLGAGNSWRRIKCSYRHYPPRKTVCVDGVLYYGAIHRGSKMMMSIDVRSENFNLITMPAAAHEVLMHPDSTLINYRGKLAFVHYSFARTEGRIDLWVLEDVGNEEWSKKSCVLPSSWTDFVGDTRLSVQGTIHTGEIILAPCELIQQFHVFYYDMRRNSIRKAKIEGIADDEFRHREGLGGDNFRFLPLFLDYVESIRFL